MDINSFLLLTFCFLSFGCRSQEHIRKETPSQLKEIAIRSSFIPTDSTSYQEQRFSIDKNTVVLHTFTTKTGDISTVFKTVLRKTSVQKQKYTTYKGLEEIAYVKTNTIGKQPVQELFYWTIKSDDEPRKALFSYERINGLPYIKEVVEYVPSGEELYRLIFDYTDFIAGELKVTKKLQGKVIEIYRMTVRFYSKFELPDVNLNQIHPLAQFSPLLMSGQLGTFDYYVEKIVEEMNNITWFGKYELDAKSRPISLKWWFTSPNICSKQFQYYQFEYK